MTDERLAAAREALARAEAAAAAGEGFLSAERQRVESTRRASASRRRARREEREADPGVGRGRRGRADAAAEDGWAAQADRGPRPDFLPDDPGASAEGAANPAGATEPQYDSPRRRGRPSPFEAPEGEPAPDPVEVARQIVLRQLAMAPRSRAQLASKLAERGCPPEAAEAVLDRMEGVGLVDDEEYAAMLVRSQVASRGLARRGLAQELRRKGIDRDIADAALDQVDSDDERRIARALVDKRLRTMGGLAVEVQTRRLAGMLARKGYSSGLAYAVIRDAIADAPEHQRD